MAGRKLTALTSLGAKPELDDEFYLVDTSDTSESPQGTSKKISGTNLAKLGGFESVNNLNAIAAPTVTDDSDSGYSVGSLWGFGDNLYKCTDASVGAAVWVTYSQTNSKTDFTPTFSFLNNCTAITSNQFLVVKTNDIVSVSCVLTVTVTASETAFSFRFDLPTEFQPNGVFLGSSTVSGFTGKTATSGATSQGGVVAASGQKLIAANYILSAHESSVQVSLVCSFNANN